MLAERFQKEKRLNDRRSENLALVIDSLIGGRPKINAHIQRRALRQLAVALEIYSRNELTDDEALRVIRTSIQDEATDASAVLNELYHSILKRTANGLTFQMRSYGEYLAAEELENATLDRVRQLAFFDFTTPNYSWSNTISYLAELNRDVRKYFISKEPFWMLSASPSAFSIEERTAVASTIIRSLKDNQQYASHEPRLRVRQLAGFITPAVQRELKRDLSSSDAIAQGNALTLLGVLKRPNAAAKALELLHAGNCSIQLERCALSALVNAGSASQVPELEKLLDKSKPTYLNVVDAIGVLCDEAKLGDFLPLIFNEQHTFGATYYRFQELRSAKALRALLRYFIGNPVALNSIGIGGYVEPLFERLTEIFSPAVAKLCVELFEAIREGHVYPDASNPFQVLIRNIGLADIHGRVPRLYYARALASGRVQSEWFYVDRTLAAILKPRTAIWLTKQNASAVIKNLSPYVSGKVREILRSCSGGVIDKQDQQANTYAAEHAAGELARKAEIEAIQKRLIKRTLLFEALNDFSKLGKDHWPELPIRFRSWLKNAISDCMVFLNLEQRIQWKGNILSYPQELPICLALIDHYELKLKTDVPIAAVTISDTEIASRYFKRFRFSNTASTLIEHLLTTCTGTARDYVLRFVQGSGLWSAPVATLLKSLAVDTDAGNNVRSISIQLLSDNGIHDGFLVGLLTDLQPDIARQALNMLADRQHKATIRRYLAKLLADDKSLLAAERGLPFDSEISWIGKIRSNFAWKSLALLRAKALEANLDRVSQAITGIQGGLDRRGTARLIRRQLNVTPPTWRHFWQGQAVEQERMAQLQQAQQTRFDEVVRKLRISTSTERIMFVCEGPTDRPVFEELLGQLADLPEVKFDFIGGWANLAHKDFSWYPLIAKDVWVVMDGDNGRHLTRADKPVKPLVRKEQKRIEAAGAKVRILERYGIENYFSREAMESVLKVDLAACFPIPPSQSVRESFKLNGRSYSKSRNAEVASHLNLERDIAGTDLYEILKEIATKARDPND